MKRLKLVILLITVILVFNINISYGRENKNSNQTTHIITVKKDNLLAVIQDIRLQQNHSNVIDENSSSIDNDSKSTKVCDFNPQKVEIVKDNTITIPNVCDNAIITVGSTQEAVNKYDVCLMTEAAASFGKGQPILLGGHNTKSLKYLYNCKIDNVITVDYENKTYKYRVVYSNECRTDNYNLFDISTGRNMLEYQTNREILQIYTCYSGNRWFVKAEKI